MLNREPEVKYVALRNIALILQKRPAILSNEIEVFYCKYRDPIYVKMEKLEIMVMLVNERNIDQVLVEFKEYSQNVDVEFVRKVVRTIGRTAIHLDKAADKCVHLLLELIKTSRVSHVIEESITVLKDIFRKYPSQYESLVSSLVEQGEAIEDPEARASLVWIIGEYVHQLQDPVEALQSYVTRFTDDPPLVQQQVLTTVVKLFLKKPKDTSAKQMLEDVLAIATEEVENPDIRDRGFVYLRLLSIAPESAKQVKL
jgi:AP-1 complex subunit beta-1